MEHTAIPWMANFDVIVSKDGEGIGYGIATVHGGICQDGYHKPVRANAEFIVRSCNSHDALVEALKNVRRTIDAALLSKRINKQVHANIDNIIQKAISEVKDNDR